MLQFQHFAGDVVGRIRSVERRAGLKNDAALVVIFIDKMDGHARFHLASRSNCLVDVMPEHPLATKFWQQRGVDVDDSIRKFADEVCRREPQKTRQRDEVNRVLPQDFEQIFSFVKLLAFNDLRRDFELGGDVQHTCRPSVADDQSHSCDFAF